jgi:hypothetical protein
MTIHPGETLLATLRGVPDLWSQVFGRDFAKSWESRASALRAIVEQGRVMLDQSAGRNQAHLTLLLREPFLDRLEIEASTQHNLSRNSMRPDHYLVPEPKENWDGERKVVYYNLCDRLLWHGARSKDDDIARTLRGLTGWVGVTGHYLKVNHEGAEQLLEHIDRERPETTGKIGIYGKPKWSRRTDEFPPLAMLGSRSKRFLAVPIFSASGESEPPIGVLRYTCPLTEPELTAVDKLALDELARLAAAVINLSTARAKAYRTERLSLETSRLQETADVRQFLTFLNQALGTRIASVYVSLDINGRRVLRLLDAVGIRDEIETCRERIKDYQWKGPGLTAELWRRAEDEPVILQSVRDLGSWAGLNTEVFYDRIFREWGLSFKGPDDLDQMLKEYHIPLLGAPLRYKGEPVGVIKVEFPTTGPSLRQFDESDKSFLQQAQQTLAFEMAAIGNMVSGKWDGPDSCSEPEMCVRRALQIIETALVTEDEAEVFWDSIDAYQRSQPDYARAIRQVSLRLSPIEKTRLSKILNRIVSNAGKGAAAGVGEQLLRLVVEGLKP